MLTGQLAIDGGDAFLYGTSVRSDWRSACFSLGYCPQFDAFLKDLSARETLKIISYLRGIKDVDGKVKQLISDVNIEAHADKPVGNLRYAQIFSTMLAFGWDFGNISGIAFFLNMDIKNEDTSRCRTHATKLGKVCPAFSQKLGNYPAAAIFNSVPPGWIIRSCVLFYQSDGIYVIIGCLAVEISDD